MSIGYLLYMVLELSFLMMIMKVFFAEIEGRSASKRYNVKYFDSAVNTFNYSRQGSIIVLVVLCYLFAVEDRFSASWFIGLIIFIACAVIADVVSQYVAYVYTKIRFKKVIAKMKNIETQIDDAMDDDEDIPETVSSYDAKEIVEKYYDETSHMAIYSNDKGKCLEDFDVLPVKTYLVQPNKDFAADSTVPEGVKVTNMTDDGRLPFKDERLDLLYSKFTNYDKYELFRVIKPGGYAVIEQLGTENYKEIMSMLIPVRIKGEWNLDACVSTVTELGYEIMEAKEDPGTIRFNTVGQLIKFIYTIFPNAPENITNRFKNFFAMVEDKINENGYFDLTTYKFIVVVKKV